MVTTPLFSLAAYRKQGSAIVDADPPKYLGK
jgi:hypothetical protein